MEFFTVGICTSAWPKEHEGKWFVFKNRMTNDDAKLRTYIFQGPFDTAKEAWDYAEGAS